MGRIGPVIGCIGCLTVLVASILILCSLSILNYNEVGLNYSKWFKNVENKTYTSGVHFIGLGHQFKRYPINLSTIEYSSYPSADLPMIKCRTSDGLEVDLEISLQYHPDPQHIYEIFHMYGDNEVEI